MTDGSAAAITPSSGRRTFSLGPVELWVVGIAASSVVGLVSLFASSITSRMEEQGKTLQTVVTQQAVTNGQLQTLSAQLADVPALTRTQAEIKVQIAEHERRITRLEDAASKTKGFFR
jgi:predicted outer membrane protein